MERRRFVSAAGTLGALLFGSESVAATRERGGTRSQGQDDRPTPPVETVIHLSSGDETAQHHALLNAKNLLEDETIPVKNLAFVANGKGIMAYTPAGGESRFYDLINSLQDRGVAFRACRNAMNALDVSEDELLEGIEPVPSGVGEVARLEELEYGYIKAP
jgi:hypothetical protein